ncbi:hypothetical protein CYMTET_56739 [Cymbomonas tetramitiformis]|uniref:Uncharacterized protein n=1 Tax=Cymbomonas tetramitiformis TaxID=36881 RepID=A0AAE0BBI2_9CHLO|nr:hypothetical protein CYMTET_56739 [Cymbomonas tetramitiformis]
MAVRELALGGKELEFEAAGDSERLSKIVVVVKNKFGSAGLDLASFDFDDPTKGVIPKVNELLYDTLAHVVKNDSAAEHFLLSTDSVSDRDGRRALLDLIKGCVPPGVCQTLQEEHSQLRYLAQAAVMVRYPMPNDLRPVPLSVLTNLITHIYVSWEQQQAELGGAVGPKVSGAAYSSMDSKIVERGASPTPPVGFDRHVMKALPLCHRCGREGVGKEYHGCVEGMPLRREGGGGRHCGLLLTARVLPKRMHSLARCRIFQVAAGDGAEAFAAAVAEYGAPAVLTGDASDGIDVSAYGFSVPGPSCVLAELEGITSQWCYGERHAAAGGAAHAVGGASIGGAPAGAVACITVPTEEFPGGVELVPLRHAVPTVAAGPPISVVTCSFEPAEASFLEAENHSEHLSIDEFLAGSADEEFPPKIYEESCVGAPACASAVLGSALAAGAQGSSGGGMAAEASVYGGVATTGEP